MIAGDASLPQRPYPGLRPYGYSDRAVFFGREDQSFALYRIVDANGFVAVIGSSGSGKSSLVLAGLAPLLEKEREQGGRPWRWEIMRPGDDPVSRLTDLLTGLSNDADPVLRAERRGRIDYQLRRSSFGLVDALREVDGMENRLLLLVVDQFEELFRLTEHQPNATTLETEQARDEATRFVQLLLEANRDPKVDVRIVITMRSDFIGDCARFHGLPEAVSRRQYLAPALTRDQRELAIVEPAKAFGGAVDSELVERLLNDGVDDMDQLPVLQHSLARLWEAAGDRQGVQDEGGRRLTTQDYNEIGKLSGALSRHANELLRDLPEADVEAVFRALSAIDGERRIIRRSLLFEELADETGVAPDALQAVLHPFRADDCSFLIPPTSKAETLAPSQRVSVGHEALLRRWERVSGDSASVPVIAGWCRDEDRDGQTYRLLLLMLDNGTQTLPLDSVDRYAAWWGERRRPAAWTERYGGRRDEVEALIKRSAAALAEQQRKEVAEEERETSRRRRVTVLFALVIAVGFYAFKLHRDNTQNAELANQKDRLVMDSTHEFIDRVAADVGRGDVTSRAAKVLFEDAEAMVKTISDSKLDRNGRIAKLTYLFSMADFEMQVFEWGTSVSFALDGVNLAQTMTAADPSDAEAHRFVGAAALKLGEARIKTPKMENYEALTSEAFSLAEAEAETAAKLAPDDGDTVTLLAEVYARYGEWKALLGRRDLEEEFNRRSLATLTAYAADENASLSAQGQLASAMQRVGWDSQTNGATEDAKRYITDAFNLRKKIADQDPDNVTRMSNLASSYGDLAKLAGLDKQWRLALTYRREDVARLNALVKRDPNSLRWLMAFRQGLDAEIKDLKQGLKAADITDAERDQNQKALIADFDRTVAVFSQMIDVDPASAKRRRDLAIWYETYGDFLIDGKQYAQAGDIYAKGLTAWEAVRNLQTDCQDCDARIAAINSKLSATQSVQDGQPVRASECDTPK